MNIKKYLLRLKYTLFSNALPGYKATKHLFTSKKGLEIGGPSQIFQPFKELPVYKHAKIVDGVNFSTATIWEGEIAQGNTYQYTKRKEKGYQFICEGSNLADVAAGAYDFVLSSHNLEHFANPLKAVKEWDRVLKPGGALLIILPDKRFTFDHRRPDTTMEHLLADYENNTQEDDLTHMEEILALHDLSMDLPAGDLAHFRQRCLSNIDNRCMHQHVFSEDLIRAIYAQFNFKVLSLEYAPPHHIIAIGQKQ